MAERNFQQRQITPAVLLVGGLFGLAVLFAVVDLDLSRAVFNPQSGWAHFLEVYGQVPGMIVTLLASNLLFNLRSRRRGAKNTFFAFLLGLYSVVTSSEFWGDMLGLQEGRDLSIWTLGFLGLGTVILLQIFLHRQPKSTLGRFSRPATIAVLLSIFAAIISVWTLKYFWGRVRFHDLAADFSNFTPWYLPQGNNGHHSFISGHTTFAWLVLPITLLFKPGSTTWPTVWIAVIIWGILGGVSRIVIGAHFASDVLFSTAITIGWFLILKRMVAPVSDDLR